MLAGTRSKPMLEKGFGFRIQGCASPDAKGLKVSGNNYQYCCSSGLLFRMTLYLYYVGAFINTDHYFLGFLILITLQYYDKSITKHPFLIIDAMSDSRV